MDRAKKLDQSPPSFDLVLSLPKPGLPDKAGLSFYVDPVIFNKSKSFFTRAPRYNGAMPDVRELYRQAEAAAVSGMRTRARELFLAYVAQEEHDLRAWQWLSRLMDDPADQIVALENALDLALPGSDIEKDLRSRLNLLKNHGAAPGPDTAAVMVADRQQVMSDALREAISLRDAGKVQDAVDLLERVTVADPLNERAWMLLSEIHAEPDQKIRALEKILELNPGNDTAAQRLDQLRKLQEDPLTRGAYLEAQGQEELAVQVYLSVETHSRSAPDRLEARRRITDIRLRQEVDQIHKVNPTVNVLRLAVGPFLLFAVMVFMQSGLNLLHMPLPVLPGLLSVLAGGLLISVTEMRPAHPKWVELFGAPGSGDEPEMRRGLRLLGWALMLAPFTIFLIEAARRLNELQSSML